MNVVNLERMSFLKFNLSSTKYPYTKGKNNGKNHNRKYKN